MPYRPMSLGQNRLNHGGGHNTNCSNAKRFKSSGTGATRGAEDTAALEEAEVR